LLSERSKHGWSIDELTSDLHQREVTADFSSVFRALARLEKEGGLSGWNSTTARRDTKRRATTTSTFAVTAVAR
jgi:Fe2+ or Zn2+ uptake regulation protein